MLLFTSDDSKCISKETESFLNEVAMQQCILATTLQN